MGANSKVVSSVGWSVGVFSSSESDSTGVRYPLLDAVGVSTGTDLNSGCCGSVDFQYLRLSRLSGKI